MNLNATWQREASVVAFCFCTLKEETRMINQRGHVNWLYVKLIMWHLSTSCPWRDSLLIGWYSSRCTKTLYFTIRIRFVTVQIFESAHSTKVEILSDHKMVYLRISLDVWVIFASYVTSGFLCGFSERVITFWPPTHVENTLKYNNHIQYMIYIYEYIYSLGLSRVSDVVGGSALLSVAEDSINNCGVLDWISYQALCLRSDGEM